MKKNTRSDLAVLIVSNSIPKAGNSTVSTLRFLMTMSTTHIALTLK